LHVERCGELFAELVGALVEESGGVGEFVE
jgi:hypothetical protein